MSLAKPSKTTKSAITKKNKLSQDKFFKFAVICSVLLILGAFLLGHFFLMSLGLLPIAIYEFIRTEGKKNTKPLSLVVVVLLVFQFIHNSKIYVFEFDLSLLLNILPVSLSEHTDPYIFLSVIILVICSLLLIKYTWGSITKFLAILLLVGSLIQASLFWTEIKGFFDTEQGQTLMDEQSEKIKNNLFYRLRRELNY
jgi:heme O synthase-like polyprenyltransferase